MKWRLAVAEPSQALPVVLLPALASSSWAYPALEVVHLMGLALLLGNLVLVELRVWGAARTLDLVALSRLALPLSLLGFGLMALSGLLMFATQPAELLANRFFVWKLGLVMLAGGNAVLFHLRGGLQRADALARLQTVLSLGLWLAALVCGRWIAYA
jgi:hypothetical protein